MPESKPFPIPGTIGGGKSSPATKAAAPKEKAAKKAPAAKKAAAPKEKKEGAIVRSASSISKEGTMVDKFTGETLPVTAFPTVKQKDGTYVRGDVARKNLADWRAANKAAREQYKAEVAAEKAAKAAEKQAAAAAAKKKVADDKAKAKEKEAKAS